MKILAHCSFIGTTGYANHTRSFFCALNKYHTVKVRNLTIGNGWKGMNNTPHNDEPYITQEMKDMLILQTLFNNDKSRTDYPMYDYKGDFKPDVHIILQDMDNYYFYEDYDGYKIGFCVYESTRFPDNFFERLLYFDEMYVPTQWQFDSLTDQGYPKDRIHIVTEGVDIKTFKPIDYIPKKDKFRFLYFGRWDYRKSTTEVLRTFGETFGENPDVELIASVENPYPYDDTRSTEDRINKFNIHYNNIKFIKFTPREEYIKYLQEGDVFVSCARSEGWGLPLCEAMACGIPSIYSNWGGQLQFAKNKGIPVKISRIRPANIGDREVGGEYCEPDFDDLAAQMKNVYENYDDYRKIALEESKLIHEEFNWDKVAKDASKILEKKDDPFVFVTAGNLEYMPTIEKLVESLNEFSKNKVLVYGVDCDVPFESPNIIKRRIDPFKHSDYDRWYWKQQVCIESIKEDYEKFMWIDGDVIVNHNINTIEKYFPQVENYPLSDIHIPEEFSGYYIDENSNKKIQLFNENLCKLWNINNSKPYMHICMFIYNKNCKWWFKEIVKEYLTVDLKLYETYFLWNDESIDNALRWKYGYKKHLPLSNFDTSGYDGDDGFTKGVINDFYKFWNEPGPQNFDKVYGYKFIPTDKDQILYFHGNKDREVSDKMIEFIKFKRDNNFYQSEYFYTDIYNLKNLGAIKDLEGSTMDIANKCGWDYAVYHEIYNLRDYYHNREKRIHNGDIVVDLGGNIGVFTRWAYKEGASKVITFEPDNRYFELLKLNSDPRSILFNAAMSDSMGTTTLYESEHLGGSNILGMPGCTKSYTVRTYTMDYLFETGLIDRIDFLKIDIEGAEHQVFRGISDENLKKVKAIGMEYHNWGGIDYKEEDRRILIERLNALGFNSYLLFLGGNQALQMLYFWKVESFTPMYRFDIINTFIKKYNYKSYLEIGTENPNNNFNKINIENKFSIDPNPIGNIDFIGTSNEYFDSISNSDIKYDIVFIDGLHYYEQLLKDIENTLNHLSDNGIIVCHDCLPSNEQMQEREIYNPSEWTGDVWKAIAQLRIERNDLEISVIDADYGCGIIKRGKNIPYQINNNTLTYDYYSKNKTELLNIITLSEFINRYK
jgi:FkbM family methyltransferase